MDLEKKTLATRRGPSLRDKDIMSVQDPEAGCNIWHKVTKEYTGDGKTMLLAVSRCYYC